MTIVALDEAPPRSRRVAIGVFDGVHLGHREVIAGADAAVTFEPHPQAVIAPGTAPKLLTSLERKGELVAELGAHELIVIPFDEELMQLTPQEFIDEILIARLGATHVSVGENFRFGNKAQGTPETLQADQRFETRVVRLSERDGEIVSSAHIRGLIAGGAMRYADELLGAPFTIDGEVVHGDKRGRQLGFPTANLVPDARFVTPAYGVYACRIRIGDEWHCAATNIGVRPQFETGRGPLIEAYVLDWSGDIYGEVVRIEFLARLRGEKRFESVDALVEQMHSDVQSASAIAGC